LAHRIGRIIERRNSVHLRHTAKADATDMWRKVRQLTGRQSRSTEAPTGITAEELNRHYANVSTDTSYQPPPTKSTCSLPSDLFTEFQVFRILDSLHHTATGLDDIPAWFLKIRAPLLSLPLAKLFNLSLSSAVVPSQWKAACITPVASHSSSRSLRFQANFYHSSPIQNNGKNHSPILYLPGTSTPTSAS